MKAVVWHGRQDVRVDEVPDPKIQESTDAIVRITSTAICGSDLHLYRVLGMFMDEGDILGHEPMGIVEEVGPGVTGLSVGDRVVVPSTSRAGTATCCDQQLYAHVRPAGARAGERARRCSAHTWLYGSVPGGQAELPCAYPTPDFGPMSCPKGPPDDRFLFLSDVLPTAWQAVRFTADSRGTWRPRARTDRPDVAGESVRPSVRPP